jgi:hypothetical protein
VGTLRCPENDDGQASRDSCCAASAQNECRKVAGRRDRFRTAEHRRSPTHNGENYATSASSAVEVSVMCSRRTASSNTFRASPVAAELAARGEPIHEPHLSLRCARTSSHSLMRAVIARSAAAVASLHALSRCPAKVISISRAHGPWLSPSSSIWRSR